MLFCVILYTFYFAGCGQKESVNVRVGSLKGPTSMGILFLMDKAQRGETEESYEFRMAAGADELLPLMAKGELDIALVPANVAALLYQKTEGGVSLATSAVINGQQARSAANISSSLLYIVYMR